MATKLQTSNVKKKKRVEVCNHTRYKSRDKNPMRKFHVPQSS